MYYYIFLVILLNNLLSREISHIKKPIKCTNINLTSNLQQIHCITLCGNVSKVQ